jgi:hypothetical protein
MKTFAVLGTNGLVLNKIVAGSLDIAESVTSSHCVEIPLNTSVDLGDSWNGTTFVPQTRPEDDPNLIPDPVPAGPTAPDYSLWPENKRPK